MKKYLIFLFCFFITSLTSLTSQEISIFDIAREGTLLQLKNAVEKDPNIINSISKEGYTPLTLACYYDNNEVVDYLIEHVKDINSKSGYGTPLMAATVKNSKESVILLLKKNANVNIADKNGTTALHYAVMFGYVDMVKLLANAKANSLLKDNRGNTAQDYAKLIKNKEIINILNQ